MADFTIKQGDTRPGMTAQLKDNEVPIDLTAATSVTFKMAPDAGGSLTVDSPCVFIDRDTGIVMYEWTTGDTATVGFYNIEFEIVWADLGVETVPNDDVEGNDGPYYIVEIKADLDP